MKRTPKFNYVLPFLFFIFFHIQNSFAQQGEHEVLYKQAVQLIDEGKKEEGLKSLNKAIELEPTYYDAIYARSYYYMTEGLYEQAINDYELLLLIRPDDYDIHVYMGQAHIFAEYYSEAEDYLLSAVLLDSLKGDAYSILGNLYYVLDLYPDALENFEKAISLNKEDISAYFYRASTYRYLKDYPKALSDIERVLKYDSLDVDAYRLKSQIFIQQKQYQKAIEVYEDAQKYEQITFAEEDFYLWAEAYYQLENYKEAIFYLELPQNPQYAFIKYALGRNYFKLKDESKALALLNQAVEMIDENDELYAPFFYDRGVVQTALKNTEAAKSDFLQALYLTPEILESKNNLNEPITLLGDLNKLLQGKITPQQVLETRVKGLQDRAETFIEEGDTDRALQTIENAINLDKEDAYSYTLRGIVRSMVFQFESAIADFDKANELTKNKNEEKICYAKALTLKELSRYDEADVLLEKAIKINPKEANYYSDRAYIAYLNDDYGNALKNIEQAILLRPNEETFLTDKALYLYENKQYDKALLESTALISNDDSNMMAYYVRGLCYLQGKQYKQAAADFKYILNTFPNDTEIKQYYEEALKQQ
ncbi:MAG: hypothetical protein EAZ55_12770 [Cytophagales bacterium]|nr:MAG: hypothetical protein EAZ55_12770 [Cytophagales bacterium]